MKIWKVPSDVFFKTAVFKTFIKLLNKVAGLSTTTLLKKKLQHVRFSVNFVKYFKNNFFTEYVRLTVYEKVESVFKQAVEVYLGISFCNPQENTCVGVSCLTITPVSESLY